MIASTAETPEERVSRMAHGLTVDNAKERALISEREAYDRATRGFSRISDREAIDAMEQTVASLNEQKEIVVTRMAQYRRDGRGVMPDAWEPWAELHDQLSDRIGWLQTEIERTQERIAGGHPNGRYLAALADPS